MKTIVREGKTRASVRPSREATQRFAIFSIMVNHCGHVLTPENVDKITDEILTAIRSGGCAWAFK